MEGRHKTGKDLLSADMAPSATTSNTAGTGRYPEPVVVQTKSGNHLQSIVVLHGRGDGGENFGGVFLLTPVPGFGTLQDALPNAKFIFPTAARRRAQSLNRSLANQWFDLWSIREQTEREDLQFEGLRETSAFVHGLLKAEIQSVGAENVVLWGLSQGCASSLIALLLWEGDKLGAALGMCGWLPLRQRLEDAAAAHDAEDNPFSDDNEAASVNTSKVAKAISCLREVLDIDGSSTTALRTPVFLGHGLLDDKVPVELGREAAATLRRFEVDIEYKDYDRLAHWYSGEMLRDILLFIELKAGWILVRDSGKGRKLFGMTMRE